MYCNQLFGKGLILIIFHFLNFCFIFDHKHIIKNTLIFVRQIHNEEWRRQYPHFNSLARGSSVQSHVNAHSPTCTSEPSRRWIARVLQYHRDKKCWCSWDFNSGLLPFRPMLYNTIQKCRWRCNAYAFIISKYRLIRDKKISLETLILYIVCIKGWGIKNQSGHIFFYLYLGSRALDLKHSCVYPLWLWGYCEGYTKNFDYLEAI